MSNRPNKKHRKSAKILAVTIVAPAGVSAMMETQIPRSAHAAERIAEKITTDLKFLNILMAEMAGNIISAVINKEPTNRMAKTMTIAVTVAIKRL